MVKRCPLCPRVKPGECFAVRFQAPHLCEQLAEGETRNLPLLTGDVEPIAVGSARGEGSLTAAPIRDAPAWLRAVNTCLYRQCRSGCQRSLCFAGRAGDSYHGQAETEVTLAQCRACLFPPLREA